MLYPIPGATGVPDDLRFIVYVTFSTIANGSITIAQSPSGAPIAVTPTSLPSPLPSPLATRFGTEPLQAATFPHLAAASAYDVVVLYPQNVACPFPNELMGSFSTR